MLLWVLVLGWTRSHKKGLRRLSLGFALHNNPFGFCLHFTRFHKTGLSGLGLALLDWV
jgi:hypothetical protein